MSKVKLIIIAAIFCSCGPSREEMGVKYNNPNTYIDYSSTPKGISVQVIDSCEYVYCETSRGVAIVHKANCKNHRR